MKKRFIIIILLLFLCMPIKSYAEDIWKNGSVSYGSYSTGKYYAGDAGASYYNAWCLQPTNTAPNRNTSFSVTELGDSDYNSIKWYTYFMLDAPGYRNVDSSAWSGYSWDEAYATSHVLLSYLYGGSGGGYDYQAGDYASWALSVKSTMDSTYMSGGSYYSIPDTFHVYLLQADGYQDMIYWEDDGQVVPSDGYITVKKINKSGSTLSGIKYALCNTYSACHDHSASWYTDANCDALSSAAAGSPSGNDCMQVVKTNDSGLAYPGWYADRAWLPQPSPHWLYIREVEDTGRSGDSNTYNVNWSTGEPKVYAIYVSSYNNNILSDEWLLKKNANEWYYSNGLPRGSDNKPTEGSDDATTNSKKKGYIKIKKVRTDGSSANLGGWKFDIYKGGTKIDTVSTGSDGTVNYGIDSSGKYTLDTGTSYTVKEQVNSNGFAINNDSSLNDLFKPETISHDVTINADASVVSTVNFRNKRMHYCLQVEKSDAEDGTKLDGFKFEISGDSSKNCTTGSTGTCKITGLNYKDYTVVEKTGKANYWVSGTKSASISKGNLTEMNGDTCSISASNASFTNYKKYYCYKVAKVDGNKLKAGNSASNSMKSGFGFKGSGSYVDSNTKNTGNDGVAIFFTGQDNSTRTVNEVSVPSGYRKATKTVSITPTLMTEGSSSTSAAGCTAPISTINLEAENNTSSNVFVNFKYVINWFKEQETGIKSGGAKFKVKTSSNTYIGVNGTETITDKSGVTKKCYVYSNSTGSSELVSGVNGEAGGVCVSGLPEGTYVVEETTPLSSHTFGDTKTKTITAAESFNNNSVFKNFKTEFRFTKTVTSNDDGIWKNLTTSELQKIPFKIYPSNSSTAVKVIMTSSGVYEYAGNTIDKPTGTETDTLYLNSSRQITVYHLPVGGYTLKEERKCCDSTCSSCSQSDDQCIGYYHPNDAGKSFTITTCSSPSATSCGSGNYATVTQSMSNTPTLISFTKRDVYSYATPESSVKFEDEAERRAFDDITFQLKDNSGNVVRLVKVTNHGNCKTDDSYAEYRYIRDNETLPSGTSRVTDLHTCGGHIKITHLCRGKNYKIEETAVPDNTVFVLPTTHPTANYNIPFSADGKNCCSNNSRTTNTTAEITNTPTDITINKKNSRPSEDIHEGTNKKETATFEVYRCAKSVSKCTKAASSGIKVKFKELATLGNTTTKTYKFSLNQTDTSGVVTTLKLTTVGDKGKIVLTYLPANYKYVVVETNAPDGYYEVQGALGELETGEISKTGSTGTKDRINYPVKIRFTKDDFRQYYKASDLDKEGSNTKIFDSMTFKLHDKDGNIVNFYKVTDGEYRFINKAGEHSGTVTELHTKDGNMLITHLYRNENYYLEETAADTEGNFILPNNRDNSSLNLPSSMSGNKHPILKYSITDDVPDSANPDDIPESLTQLIDNDSTRVVFEKRDKKTGELIDDNKNDVYVEDDDYQNVLTTFNIYRCEKTVSHCTTSNGTLMHFEDRTYIKDKNNVDITSDLTSVTPPVLAYKYKKLNADGITDLHTDRGILVVAYLPSKYKYVLHETVAPNGYYNPAGNTEDIEFTVKDSSLTTGETYEALTTRVENTPTEIHFTKKDLYNYYNKDDLSKIDSDIKIFDSMKFVLRNKEGKILKLKCSNNYEATGEHNEDRCRTGEYRYIPIDENNTIENMHTLDGNITITHLYRDEVYYIEEVSEDTEGDFILPDYLTYSEGLPFDHKGHPVVKYIVPPNAPADQASVTQIINNIPSRVIFQKRDSKYNYLIPDERTTFNVYQCNIDTEKCTPEVGKIINFTERDVITGDQEDNGKEVYKYSKLNASGITDLHPYRGELILRYLPTKYKYVLVETVSPQGYMLPEGENAYTYFTISETKVEVEEIQVPNKPVSLLIRKYNQDGELLEDATFNISKTKNCNFNVAPNKVEREELLNLKTIRDGVYEVRPQGDTKLFKTCKDRPDYMCNQINRTLTYPDYDTDVFGNSMGDFEALVNSRNERINIEAGEALIQYLDFGGCYIIEEVEAPKGYSLPENEEDRFVMIKITDKEQVFDTYEELVNTPTPFSFYKQDEYGKPLDGAKYKLQKLNDKKVYQDVPVTRDESFEDQMVYKVDLESNNYIMETNGGKATISYLEEGQYRVLEVEAPEGYDLPKKTMNVATFYVDKDGKVFGSSIIANKPKTPVNKKFDAYAKATFVVNIDTGQKIIKYGLVIGLLIFIISSLIVINTKKNRD